MPVWGVISSRGCNQGLRCGGIRHGAYTGWRIQNRRLGERVQRSCASARLRQTARAADSRARAGRNSPRQGTARADKSRLHQKMPLPGTPSYSARRQARWPWLVCAASHASREVSPRTPTSAWLQTSLAEFLRNAGALDQGVSDIDVELKRHGELVVHQAGGDEHALGVAQIQVAMADCVIAESDVVAVGDDGVVPWLTVSGTK